jgi:hypothetical protein
MMVLNHLLAKPMKRARYFCAGAIEETTEFGHFALSIPDLHALHVADTALRGYHGAPAVGG